MVRQPHPLHDLRLVLLPLHRLAAAGPRRADEKVPHAIKRFFEEAVRLYSVLDKQLGTSEFVAGAYSIADMAIYPWSFPALEAIESRSGVAFEHVTAWHKRMAERHGVAAGMNIPASQN